MPLRAFLHVRGGGLSSAVRSQLVLSLVSLLLRALESGGGEGGGGGEWVQQLREMLPPAQDGGELASYNIYNILHVVSGSSIIIITTTIIAVILITHPASKSATLMIPRRRASPGLPLSPVLLEVLTCLPCEASRLREAGLSYTHTTEGPGPPQPPHTVGNNGYRSER
jgi:hypothetical protein